MSSAVPFVFLGTPRFGEIVLKTLLQKGLIPSLVVCNPDQPLGRKKIITPPPTKRLALEHDIPVWQPRTLTEAEAKEKFGDAVVAVVAAYGKIIPASVLAIPRRGTLGIHPSLLPRLRGATPLQSAILEGGDKTGVSLFVVDHKVDHGPVLAEREFVLSTQTYLELEEQLAVAGAGLFSENVEKWIAGTMNAMPQDEAKATFTKKFITADAFVEFAELTAAQTKGGAPATKIYRMIRALNPEPGVWTLEDGKRMKLLEAKLLPGGELKLNKIQYEGKTPQTLA